MCEKGGGTRHPAESSLVLMELSPAEQTRLHFLGVFASSNCFSRNHWTDPRTLVLTSPTFRLKVILSHRGLIDVVVTLLVVFFCCPAGGTASAGEGGAG